MQNFFLLSNVDYDYEDQYFLEGPSDVTQEQFRELCCNLVERAGMAALEAAKNPRKYNDGTEYLPIVNSDDVMKQLVKLLEPTFKQFFPKKLLISESYIGIMGNYSRMQDVAKDKDSILFHLKDAYKMICEHNQIQWDKMHEQQPK